MPYRRKLRKYGYLNFVNILMDDLIDGLIYVFAGLMMLIVSAFIHHFMCALVGASIADYVFLLTSLFSTILFYIGCRKLTRF